MINQMFEQHALDRESSRIKCNPFAVIPRSWPGLSLEGMNQFDFGVNKKNLKWSKGQTLIQSIKDRSEGTKNGVNSHLFTSDEKIPGNQLERPPQVLPQGLSRINDIFRDISKRNDKTWVDMFASLKEFQEKDGKTELVTE